MLLLYVALLYKVYAHMFGNKTFGIILNSKCYSQSFIQLVFGTKEPEDNGCVMQC